MAINDFLSVICISLHVNDYYDHRFNTIPQL
jgi:hypothetical protein